MQAQLVIYIIYRRSAVYCRISFDAEDDRLAWVDPEIAVDDVFSIMRRQDV